MGWYGTFGFYEAVDYSTERADVLNKYSIVRAWMVHHQGMALLALCNFMRNNVIQDYFHLEPSVEATERILQERTPKHLKVETQQKAPVTHADSEALPSAVS